MSDSETELVVKPETSSLSAGLVGLLASPELRQRMVLAAQNRVAELKARAVVSRIANIYHDLVATRRPYQIGLVIDHNRSPAGLRHIGSVAGGAGRCGPRGTRSVRRAQHRNSGNWRSDRLDQR